MRSIAALACAVGALLLPSHAQAENDVALWLEVGAKVDLTKKLSVDFSQHLRLDQDASRVASVMPEVGLELDVWKWLEFGIGYRYEYERAGDSLEGAHRLQADAKLDSKLAVLHMSYRLRAQQKVGSVGSRRLRNRLQLEIDWDLAWIPVASGELFHDVGGERTGWDKTRFTVGAAFELMDRDVQTFARVDIPRDPSEPLVQIVGLELRTKL